MSEHAVVRINELGCEHSSVGSPACSQEARPRNAQKRRTLLIGTVPVLWNWWLGHPRYAKAAGDRPSTSDRKDEANVRDYGAKGDGTSDDTAAIQRAIDSARIIKFPHGAYFIGSATGLSCQRSDTRLVGVGSGSVSIVQGEPVKRLLTISGQPHGQQLQPAVERVSIQGIEFVGRSLQAGFSEHTHLLVAIGVNGVTISDCEFKGFRGDAIYLGFPRRHAGLKNKNVRIERCSFDGINRQNRNGVSIIHGNMITVRDCSFRNISQPTMPGSIDIEPNKDAGHSVDEIIVERCQFYDESGRNGHVSLSIGKDSMGDYPRNIVIRNNAFNAGHAVGIINRMKGLNHNFRIEITGNRMSGVNRPLDIQGEVNGLTFSKNVVSHKMPLRISSREMGLVKEIFLSSNEIEALYPSADLDLEAVVSGEISLNKFRNYNVAESLKVAEGRALKFTENVFD